MSKELTPIQLAWVKALESGEYKQGTGQLYNPSEHSFCCLGVACAINGIEKPRGMYLGGFHGDIQDKLGLETTYGRFTKDGASFTLASLNDSGKSFKEIAAIIRSKPEGLFNE